MQTHTTGPIEGSRNGSSDTTQSFAATPVNMGATGAGTFDKRLFKVKASPAVPVRMQIYGIIGSAWGASTTTIALGTSQGGAQLMAASNAQAAATTPYVPVAVNVVFTADTEVWARAVTTGTVPQATGVSYFAFQLNELNTDPI